ncbi:MAG: DUF2927 domain-containing protein [Psychrobium sp.]|nr:DUF2927 domain-containing protein [Psychrobium sp.]
MELLISYFSQQVKRILRIMSKFVIVFSMFFVTFAHAADRQQWQSLQFITDSFYEIALGDEYGTSAYSIKKWNKPLRIYVEHQTNGVELHNQLLNAHIKHLKQITGLDIERTKHAKNANIHFFFTKEKMLQQLVAKKAGSQLVKYTHGSLCMATIRANKAGNIISANVFIPVDRAMAQGKLLTCIVEELTQSLGLIRDSDLVFPSIFNDNTKNNLLTGLDEILLKMLYDKRIVTGMTKDELAPIINEMVKEYQRNGTIASANRRVQQGELYALMGYRSR